MGFILFLIATLLWLPLTLINFIVVFSKTGISNRYFNESAIDIDKFANRNFRAIWNITLKNKDGYQFGDVRETISSALGKNQRDNTLTSFGLIMCSILDGLDKKHCEKSINNFESDI